MTKPKPPGPRSQRAIRIDRIQGLLAAYPARDWRPVEVAEALGESTHQVATGLYALADSGLVERLRPPGRRWSTYRHKEVAA